MRDKTFYNTATSVFMNKKMKEYVDCLSENRDNSKQEIGKHHVIHDALCLLYEKREGKVFSEK